MELRVNASDENLHKVLSFVENELEAHDCLMKDIMMITVIVEEVFVNIAHYAYEGNVGEATIKVEFIDNDVIITFIDSGIPFDPTAKEDPDIGAPAEDRDIGGLGIYMVKKTMDEMKYERIDDQNVLTLRKGIK